MRKFLSLTSVIFCFSLCAVITIGTSQSYEIKTPKYKDLKTYEFLPSMYGCFTEKIDGRDNLVQEIKEIGCEYVIFYTYQLSDNYLSNIAKDISLFCKYGIGVVLYINCNSCEVSKYAKRFAQNKNLVGWYVYDEPTLHNIPISEQEAKIKELKAIKDLPCFTTECGANIDLTNNQLSTMYDYVFTDVYVTKTRLNKNSKILDSYAMMGNLCNYEVNKIIPVYETYWETENLWGLKENLRIKKSMFLNSGAFFIYSANETKRGFNTISTSGRLKDVAKNVVESNNKTKLVHIVHPFNENKLLTGTGSLKIRLPQKVSGARFYYVLEGDFVQNERVRIDIYQKEKMQKSTSVELNKRAGSFVLDRIDTELIEIRNVSGIDFSFVKLVVVAI